MSPDARHVMDAITRDIDRSCRTYAEMIASATTGMASAVTATKSLASRIAETQSLATRSLQAFESQMTPRASELFEAMTSANMAVAKAVIQAAERDTLMAKCFADTHKWHRAFESAAYASILSSLTAPFEAATSLRACMHAQSCFRALDTSALGSLLNASEEWRRSHEVAVGHLTRSYRAVVESLPATPPECQPLTLTFAPREYARHIEVLESLSCDPVTRPDLTETEDNVLVAIARVDSELGSLLRGARAASNATHPDRCRHVAVSLREMLAHLMRRLAPDHVVTAWTNKDEHFHNGRPTRRARLLYICRTISDSPLESFVEADVDATISLFDVLNSGTHAAMSRLTQQQLFALVKRAEGVVQFLLHLDNEP